MAKKGVTPNFPPLCGIEQNDSLTLLGVTFQKDKANCSLALLSMAIRHVFLPFKNGFTLKSYSAMSMFQIRGGSQVNYPTKKAS